MKTKDLLSACSVFVVTVSFATSSFAEFEEDPEDPPVGCLSSECEEPEGPKGNNGWGNGSDEVDGLGGTNNGSFTGGTAVTKSVNGLGSDKFDEKFEDGR